VRVGILCSEGTPYGVRSTCTIPAPVFDTPVNRSSSTQARAPGLQGSRDPKNASRRGHIPLSNPTLILRLLCAICSHSFHLSPLCRILLPSIRSTIPLADTAVHGNSIHFLYWRGSHGKEPLLQTLSCSHRATIFRRMTPRGQPMSRSHESASSLLLLMGPGKDYPRC